MSSICGEQTIAVGVLAMLTGATQPEQKLSCPMEDVFARISETINKDPSRQAAQRTLAKGLQCRSIGRSAIHIGNA
eukprot:6281387-Amphidinium_carterae.1